jgi:hypothetical protein
LPSGREIYDKGGIEEYKALSDPQSDSYSPNLVLHLDFSERLYLLGKMFLFSSPSGEMGETAKQEAKSVKENMLIM